MAEQEQDTIEVRGPPLRPKKRNPMSDPVMKLLDSYSSPTPIEGTQERPRNPILASTSMILNEEEEDDDDDVPATGGLYSRRIAPLPSSSLIPQAWKEFSDKADTTAMVQSYVQDLYVIEVAREENLSPVANGIPLCPFILAHLQPSNRIIPYVPLTIPSCSEYRFLLLHVLKETTTFSSGEEFIDYIAVFSMIYIGLMNSITSQYPKLVGTRASLAFVEQVRKNVRTEKVRIQQVLHNTMRAPFSLRESAS
jgi:hypothetical protein